MVVALDLQHRVRCVAIEFAVQPTQEISLRRFVQRAGGAQPVDLGLHADMRGRFQLQMAALRLVVEVAGQSPCDVAWPRVMPLDEVAVVGVHDADEAGEVGGGRRMQALAQCGALSGELGDSIGEAGGDVVQAGRFDTAHGFFRHGSWPIQDSQKGLKFKCKFWDRQGVWPIFWPILEPSQWWARQGLNL